MFISVNVIAQTRIYCKPDVSKCVSNLNVLKKWVIEDYLDTTISAKTYDQYKSILINTIAGLEMIIENKNQCDTTDSYIDFKYTSK